MPDTPDAGIPIPVPVIVDAESGAGNPQTPGDGQGVVSMADAVATADTNVMSTILTGMAGAAAAESARRTGSFDQLASNAAAVWTASLVTPTVNMGLGFRVTQQPGGYPAGPDAGTGGTTKQ